jgi:hypothetical protein
MVASLPGQKMLVAVIPADATVGVTGVSYGFEDLAEAVADAMTGHVSLRPEWMLAVALLRHCGACSIPALIQDR